MNLEQRIDANPRFSALLFAGLAAILFHPFFFGKFVVGGTDVLYAHYPNILFGYREFWHFGNFSLWNRYIFCGLDFTGSMHAHFLNPLYWPLLLFPEKYIFHALTAGFIVMNALTGWFWSRIAARLGVSGMGNLLVGVVAQAGMFFWFAMTTMIAVPMYLCASIAIYLILSREARGGLANYLTLSTVLGFLFVTPHPTYILGFFLPVAGVVLTTTYSKCVRCPWRGYVPIFVASCMTGLLLAAYRTAPVGFALTDEGALIEQVWLKSFLNHAYFGLTAFNPLALGINIFDSLQIAQLLDLGAARHIQAHNALYFGIAPLVMVYVAMRAGGGTKVTVLAIAWIVPQLAYLYALQPISDLVYLAFYPLGHEGLFRPISNFAFLFLLIECLNIFRAAGRASIQKAIRECIVIAGLVIVFWAVMYARMLHHDVEMSYEVPDVVSKVGFKTFVNSIRIGIFAIMLAALMVCRLPLRVFGSLRFGLLGVTAAALLMILADVGVMVISQLPGTEMAMEVFKNGLIVICACLAILLGGMNTAKVQLRIALFFVLGAFLIFVLPMPLATVGRSAALAPWAAVIGWGMFIALMAVTLNVLGRFANGDVDGSTAVKLMLVLTVVDLITAFGNYSYVNVPSAPFFRRLTDIYPISARPAQLGRQNIGSEDKPAAPNLLRNPELRLATNQLAGWDFGGEQMALCPQAVSASPLEQTYAVRLCYPRNDGAGNLYQDVSLKQDVRQIAIGVWVLAETGMEFGLFLTSPSNDMHGRFVRGKGDGKWHWIQTSLAAREPLRVVRPHINLAKAGHVEVYAPKLTYGTIVNPDAYPRDGRAIVQPRNDLPMEVDLASYRVNRVHAINHFSPNELMTNFAVVAGTPTYAGVDSDLSRDFVSFLSSFKKLDSSWFSRGGLYSSLENQRLLDLLGVGYDLDSTGELVFRRNAIPRLAAFSDFEVEPSWILTLERLKASDFDPTTAVLLREKPSELHSRAVSSRFRKLFYRTHEADRLTAYVSADTPRLIVFNDRFSPAWKAYWNGQPLQIFRANGIFMAVVVPFGEGELSFNFRPTTFYILTKISAGTAVLLLLFGVIYLLRIRHWEPRTPKPKL